MDNHHAIRGLDLEGGGLGGEGHEVLLLRLAWLQHDRVTFPPISSVLAKVEVGGSR